MSNGLLFVVAVTLLTTTAYAKDEVDTCAACTQVFTEAFAKFESTNHAQDGVKVATDVLDDLCDTLTTKSLETYCRELIVDSDTDFGPVLAAGNEIPDICIAAEQCETPFVPAPAEPVNVEGKHATVGDVLSMFHAAGNDGEAEDRRNLLAHQSNVQLEQMGQIAHNMAPTINVAAPAPVGGGSGLAWDKHDMDVVKNKGGDVEVEVNLAAPIGGIGGGEMDSEDMTALMEAIQEPETDNRDQQYMDMIQQMQLQMQAPAKQMQQLMQGLMVSLKDITSRQAPPPPQAPQMDVPAIIEAMHPPAQPVQPPVDIASLMRAMREALAAGRDPPPCPPGVDPALLDLLKSTLQELKDMHKEGQQQQAGPPAPPGPPAPQPSPAASPAPRVVIPPFPPSQKQGLTMEDLQAMLQKMYRPPALPSFGKQSSDDLDALKAMMAAHLRAASKPIVLPPPSTPTDIKQDTIPPPPPPPAGDDGSLRDELLDLLKQSASKPQRIPAPPAIHPVTETSGACCVPPPPEDTRKEGCPIVNGAPLPRCKRKPSPALPMRCNKPDCSGNLVFDTDADVDLDATTTPTPCQGPNCAHSETDDFNPKSLLAALSRPTPKNKPSPNLISAQTGN